jgi:superfamily I DNA/RNA helicase
MSQSSDGGLSSAINLVTPEDSKGLEFDAVIVADPQSILDMPHGGRMLYIALTRIMGWVVGNMWSHLLDPVVMNLGKRRIGPR